MTGWSRISAGAAFSAIPTSAAGRDRNPKSFAKQVPENLVAQQVKNFCQKISALKIEPHVASIHPKQYVQNISDTTAREEAGGGKGSRAITIYQGITRQPLAVGYSRGKNEFGWVLGPGGAGRPSL